MVDKLNLARLVKTLFNGDRMMKPESQTIGIAVMYPMMSTASGTFFLFVIFKTNSASDRTPPDFSRNVPMIVPAAITIPMELNVPPNPSAMDLTISGNFVPERRPNRYDAKIKAKKGWSLHLTVLITTKIIDNSTSTGSQMLNYFPPFSCSNHLPSTHILPYRVRMSEIASIPIIF